MALQDYSEDDDFYSQGFEKKGALSVWVGLKERSGDIRVDTLQDLCGVGYYRLSDHESNTFDYQLVELAQLLAGLSYSASFIDDVVSVAQRGGIKKARRVIVQYDFAYNPAAVIRKIEDDPIFLGVFNYSDA